MGTYPSYRYGYRYTYDTGHRILSMTYPDNRTITYARDSLGRIEAVTTTVNGTTQTIVANRTYRADGLLTAQTYGNGLNETRRYNIKGELTEQFVGAADTRLYSYDPNGNLTHKQSLPEVGTYTYDALDRLRATTRDAVNETYAYDPNGNRVSDSKEGTATAYAYQAGSNRLAEVADNPLTLDPAGNPLSDGRGRVRIPAKPVQHSARCRSTVSGMPAQWRETGNATVV